MIRPPPPPFVKPKEKSKKPRKRAVFAWGSVAKSIYTMQESGCVGAVLRLPRDLWCAFCHCFVAGDTNETFGRMAAADGIPSQEYVHPIATVSVGFSLNSIQLE